MYLSLSTLNGTKYLSIPVPWGEIRGKVWGPEHGRPVLCLHGWADNCGSFSTLVPLLPKGNLWFGLIDLFVCFFPQYIRFRYLTVDLAGHGLSSHRPPGDFYCFPSYVADVRRVVDGLYIHELSENPLFTALYPEMVDGLVLLDVYGFLPTDTRETAKVMRQGMNEMIEFEKKAAEKKRVYTYEKAVERMLAVNPTLSDQSVHIMLERGLIQVEGGFVFSRDLRVNFKNIVRFSLEQSLLMQKRIRSGVLVILSQNGFHRMLSEPSQKKFTSILQQQWKDRNDTVVTVPGDHHVHLTHPEVVAPYISDFLRTKVLSQSANSYVCRRRHLIYFFQIEPLICFFF
uniref:Serine hydrolase like n=1 Tax=Sphaeramia orbicularis TaxID=375764 RepID=A0A672Y7Z7_9TELE